MAKPFYIDAYKTFDELAKAASIDGPSEHLSIIGKFGYNEDIDSGTAEDVWDAGGTRHIFTSAETFNVVSSNTNDTSAGTGARLVAVQGLDADGFEQTEVVTMNGTSNVATTNSFLDINRVTVVTAGSNNTNAGDITVTGVTSGQLCSQVLAGRGITSQTHYRVPHDKVGYFLDQAGSVFRSSGTGVRKATVNLNLRLPSGVVLKTAVYGATNEANPGQLLNVVSSEVQPGTLIWYDADATQNNTGVSITYSLVLVDKKYVLSKHDG